MKKIQPAEAYKEAEGLMWAAKEVGEMINEAWSSSRLARELTRYIFHPQVVRRFAPFHIDSSQPALGAWLKDFTDGALPHTRGDDRNTIFHIAATPEEISFRCQKC